MVQYFENFETDNFQSFKINHRISKKKNLFVEIKFTNIQYFSKTAKNNGHRKVSAMWIMQYTDFIIHSLIESADIRWFIPCARNLCRYRTEILRVGVFCRECASTESELVIYRRESVCARAKKKKYVYRREYKKETLRFRDSSRTFYKYLLATNVS